MLLVLRFPLFSRSRGSQDSFQLQQNNGKRRAGSASDAPNCSHRRFDLFKVPVARIWRVRGVIGSTFSTFLVVFFMNFQCSPFSQNSGKRRARSGSDAPNSSHSRFSMSRGSFVERSCEAFRKPRCVQDGVKTAQNGVKRV